MRCWVAFRADIAMPLESSPESLPIINTHINFMSKYNKFNPGKTKEYFPINAWRCNSSRHPVITSSDKCASSTPKARFSQQELQMLLGLSNTLQCSEREAVRIALYEASARVSDAYETAFVYASSESREKGHQGRSSTKQWKLPKPEQVTAMNAAKELGITNAEFVRLSIIWLQQGIRNNSITSIEKCEIISGDKVARQWSKENHGKPQSEQVAHLKQALQESQQLFDYMNQIQVDERYQRSEGIRSMSESMRAAIAQEITDFNEAQDQWFEDLLDGDSIEDIKYQMAFSFVRNFKVDWDTAILIVEDDFLDKKDAKKMRSIEKLRLIEIVREKAVKYQNKENDRLQELKKSREEQMIEWEEYMDSLPKTWTAFVNGVRMARRMTCKTQGDPFPHLPDPLPRNFPMPANWPEEDMWPDNGREETRTFYFWMQNCQKSCYD